MPVLKIREFKRMNTKAQDLRMDDSDLRLLVNAEYEKAGSVRKVKGYQQQGDTLSAILSQDFNTQAEWLGGAFSDTETQGDTLVLKGSAIEQSVYNDHHQVSGNNWFAQSFTATSTSVSKVSLFLDKVLGSALQSYDNFDDNSFDTTRWNQTGTDNDIVETGGKLQLFGYRVSGNDKKNTIITTNDKTAVSPAGEPILGAKFFFSGPQAGENGDGEYYVELTNGADIIRIYKLQGTTQFGLSAAGSYGVGTGTELTRVTGTGGTFEVVQVGLDVKLYFNGVLFYTFANKSIASNTYFLAKATGHGSTTPDSDQSMTLDSIFFYASATAIQDLDIRIETNSSGSPSGSLVSNGSTTIDDAAVLSGSVIKIDGPFSTPPTTVVGTTYWIVVKTSGGDSSNYYRVYKQNSSLYSGGQTKVSTNAGSTWADDGDAPSDMAFILYGSPASSGTWRSSNITLASGQTMSQIKIDHSGLSGTETISRVDITNTSNVVQSSYTTPITSGGNTTLFASDFDNGFSFTLDTDFRIRLTLTSGGTATPVISALVIDSSTREISELSPFYQSSGTKALIAVVAGTVKRLSSSVWATIKTGLTAGVVSDSVIFRASKATILASGTADSGDLTSLTDAMSPEPSPNYYQGKMIKIVGGRGAGQVRVIQQHTGTSTSTTTSTTTTTTTSSSTSTSAT